MENKPKIKGWRKVGIGAAGITALSLNPTMDFKIALCIVLIVFVIAITQGILDHEKKEKKPVDRTT